MHPDVDAPAPYMIADLHHTPSVWEAKAGKAKALCLS
jgi:hypothetical protein